MTQKSLFTLSTMTVACALALGTISANAADIQKDAEIHALDKVTVEDVVEKNGQTTMTAADLDIVPSATNTITDAFRGESFIQFDQASRTSGAGAELTPPQISIRGGRNYENNFTINGLSNNSMLMPSGWQASPTPRSLAFSDAQAVMLTTDLLDNVTVLSENVGAEYGDFTGGVIDAQIRDAASDRWHVKAWTRHTRDSWAQQHWTDTQASMDFPSTDKGTQKEFKRTESGVTFDGPLMDGKLGALVSYTNAHSSTPTYVTLKDRNVEQKGKRDLENFMVHVNTDKANDFYAAATLMYSPYESENYSRDQMNSRFSHVGGGWNFTLNTRANLSFGQWKNDIGYSSTEASVETDTNITNQWLYDADGYPNWITKVGRSGQAYAEEGAAGDWEFTQEQYNYKSVLDLNPVKLGATEHNFSLGVELKHTEVKSDMEDWILYEQAQFGNMHGTKADGILDGSQVAMHRETFTGAHRSESIFESSIFAEDTITIDRFTVRPGVRVSYDDLTEDVNVAPRFFANMDVMNDGRFNLNVGANRYYGSQVLYNAIGMGNMFWKARKGEKRHWTDDTKTEVSGWEKDPMYWDTKGQTSLGDISTPYADEFVLGGSAVLADTLFKVKAVKRDHKDQLRINTNTGDAMRLSELTNEGKTEYKGVTFSVEKAMNLGSFGRHKGEFGVTWSKLKSNSADMLNTWNSSLESDYVYVDGVKMNYDDLEAPNFNAEWVLTYNHNASFLNDRLRADLLMRWESGSDRLVQDADIDGCDSFRTRGQDHMFNTDLSLAYDIVKTSNTTVTVNLDALNLFDNKSLVNNSVINWREDVYNMGRQFYLGLSIQY